MGSVLVEAMAHGSVGEPSSKQLHPFFMKGPPGPATPSSITDNAPQDENDEHSTAESRDGDEPRKRRKTEPSDMQDGPDAKKARRNRQIDVATSNGSILGHLTKSNQEPQPPAAMADDTQPQHPSPPPAGIQPSETSILEELPLDQNSTTAKPETASTATPDPSKKVLKLNPRTGTLRSPPKPKPHPIRSRIICLKYGRDEEQRKILADKITQIMDGRLKLPADTYEVQKKKPGRKPKDGSANRAATSKTKLSFFTNKPKQAAGQSASVEAPKRPAGKNSVFMSTPVSPRKPRAPLEWTKVPPLGTKSSGLRIPGGKHPLWPPQDMCHIRGDEPHHRPSQGIADPYTRKKSKGQAVLVAPQESVMHQLASRLNVRAVRDSLPRDPNKFAPAPPELRLPVRHFESGRKLQQRIRPQLRTLDLDMASSQIESSQEEIPSIRRKRTHPAVAKWYNSLATNLSAYDMSNCESLTWVQKYAPTTALEVLQAGKEAILLKQWLEALEVQSVDTGSGNSATSKSKAKGEEGPKKKRKKNKLDGFIVDSDDEANELNEVSDSEDGWAPAGSGVSQKTIVRNGNGKNQVRPANTVLISGSHGSGKTAAVHAIAKELGFEIFEIHAGSRRNGRDILEKVGDMTRNHLVQRHKAQQPANPADGEDGVAKDLKSGKQGTMMSFFKPKPDSIQNKPPQAKQTEQKTDDTVKSSATKAQKQSLILLEEVDILFEEDKQFWATLTDMIAQSKRPFIMTCNDEKLVPMHSLKLHGIFRFAPPPTDLAVDLCLLAAANEGHALQRSSVQALYEARSHDLRATLSELNYWCQIGVGDRKGGFDWFYLRWPKGSDQDDNGDVVRVISEDTYTKGMGWVGRDPIIMEQDHLETELEAFNQSWDTWGLDMDDWRNTLGLDAWAKDAGRATPRSQEQFAGLSAYSAFCDSLSDADVCSGGFSATSLQEFLDPSLPDLPTKARDDFIIGRTLLEAEPIVRQSSPHVSISMSLNSLAKVHLRGNTHHAHERESTGAIKLADEDTTITCIEASFYASSEQLSRLDIAYAFDPIAVSTKTTSTAHLDPSIFDQTTTLIALDVAPWVRGIVAYDQRLMTDRLKLSNLLSEGGKRKRMRKTRAAYSALEGGERGSTRRERYFGDCLVTGYVMRTGGHNWQEAIPETRTVEDDGQGLPPSSPMSEDSLA